MLHRFFLSFSLTILASVFLLPVPASAETFVSHNASERIIVAFKAAEGGAQSALPEGWSPAPSAEGPLAGADTFLVFIENQRYADAEGKPKFDGRFRGLAVAVPAKNEATGKGGFMVTHVFISDGTINPYSNTVVSEVEHTISKRGVNNAPLEIKEEWDIEPSTGGEIELEVTYSRGLPGLISGTSNIYSNVEPDFYRIYKYNQFADLIHSVPANAERVSELEVEIDVPALSVMFDGTEQLVGIVNLPWYWRETWLP
jgi:hypothetical protein